VATTRKPDAETGHRGHDLAFTIGRGNEVQTAAIHALAPFVVGRPLGATMANLHLGLLVSSSSRPVGLMTPGDRRISTFGGRLRGIAWSCRPVAQGVKAMTRSLRRVDWAALGANLGSTVLFTLLLLSPFLWGAHYTHWLLGLAIGIILGLFFYLRRERYQEPGLNADETRFPR
jgi:hypothetical protein